MERSVSYDVLINGLIIGHVSNTRVQFLIMWKTLNNCITGINLRFLSHEDSMLHVFSVLIILFIASVQVGLNVLLSCPILVWLVWLTGWLAGWVGLAVDWRVGCLTTVWLMGCGTWLDSWLMGWIAGWLTDWRDWLIDGLGVSLLLTDGLHELLAGWLTEDWVAHWLTDGLADGLAG